MKAIALILMMILLLCLATDAFRTVLKSASLKNKIKRKLNYDTVDRYLKPFENDSNIPNPEINDQRLVRPCIDRAVKCDSADCDCSAFCSDPELVEKVHVFSEDEFYFKHFRLSEGTYCLPKGSHDVPCRKNLGSLVYSDRDRWVCLCRFPEIFNGSDCSDLVACKNSDVGENFGNDLWDTVNDAKVDVYDVSSFGGGGNGRPLDFYERKEDGSPRFTCKCGGLDNSMNRMVKIPELHLQCFVDRCKAGTHNSSVPGYDLSSGECDCGDDAVTRQKNVVAFDRRSPCTACHNRYSKEEGLARFYIPCFVRSTPVDAPEAQRYPCLRFHESNNFCDTGTIRMRLSD